MSIYYQATRAEGLSESEAVAVRRLIDEKSVEDQIAEYSRAGSGMNWESFCVYDPAEPTEPGAIFEGATGLPDISEEACWIGIQHWCGLLTNIRRVLPNAKWYVAVDDHEIAWDDVKQAYDPAT